MLAQFGGTSGRVDGQYTPEALQLELYPQASGSSQPLTRLYISKDETLYDAGQLYRTLRSSITDNYPLAGVLIPEWNMGSYISQTQLASLLDVDDTATSLQSMNDFQLDLKKIKKVQPENAKEGYLYFRLETDDTAADSPVLTLGVEKSGLLRAASPAVHILLDIPAHGIHVELTEDNRIHLDFHVIVAYGVSISAVTDNLISNVKYKVEAFTGMEIEKINIYVEGVRAID